MYKTKIIKEKTAGHRTINGTDWPIVVEVLREQFDNQRPYWIVRSHCNGIGIFAEHFSTRRDAVAVFSAVERLVDYLVMPLCPNARS